MAQNRWPYANAFGEEEHLECDVLVLGGGLAGTYAAIAAARRGKKVILMEKAATSRAGSAGSGFDHWEGACTNPCCKITPEELTKAYIDEQDHYSNGIAHYIEAREGWDRLLDMESFGGKIRDTEDEFKGADFRDDKTKLMFAYDYTNCYTLRIWGTGFKPALYKECLRLGVTILDRTEATSLLTKRKDGKIIVSRSPHRKAAFPVLYVERYFCIWISSNDLIHSRQTVIIIRDSNFYLISSLNDSL